MPKRLLSLLMLLVLLFPSVAPNSVAQEAAVTNPQSSRFSPVMFIENVGQFAEGAHFQVLGGDNTMWLAEDALWLTVVERPAADMAHSQVDPLNRFDPERATAQSDSVPRKAANIKLSFVGANLHPRIEPFDRLDTVVSYFLGNDPDKWRPDVPVWGGVRYVDLYPGVDLEITSEGGQMVQRLAARPGADLTRSAAAGGGRRGRGGGRGRLTPEHSRGRVHLAAAAGRQAQMARPRCSRAVRRHSMSLRPLPRQTPIPLLGTQAIGNRQSQIRNPRPTTPPTCSTAPSWAAVVMT